MTVDRDHPGTATRKERAGSVINWAPLVVVFVGVFMAIMDGFIVMIAAPAIQRDLRASDAGIQFILAGYTLTYAVTLVIGGRLGDHFGRRRVFIAGIALFTVASLACGLAVDAGMLIISRLIQGFGSALLFPQAFSVIQVIVPAGVREKAFAALGVAMGSSTIVGQLLGGLLVQLDLGGLSWRPVFLINVPIGVLTVLAARRLLPESKASDSKRLDIAGSAVLAVALFLLVLPLIQGRELGWPWWAWASLAGSAPVLAVFVRVEHAVATRGRSPLVDFTLFRSADFTIGLILVLVWYTSINSFFLVLSLVLQDGLGLSALEAGIVYAPFAVAFVVASLVTGKLATKLGDARLFVGVTITTLAFLGMAVTAVLYADDMSAGILIPLLVLQGVGNGFFQTPLLNAVLRRVSDKHVGVASGALSTAQQVGGTVGVAVIGVAFFQVLGTAGHGEVTAWTQAFAASVAVTAVVGLGCLLLLAVRRKRQKQY